MPNTDLPKAGKSKQAKPKTDMPNGMQPDMQKVDALVGRLVGDLGAGVSGVLVVLGDHLG
ncbi:MAG: SAM-dependent methyltransferase, partial [Rhizobium sp.]